MNQAANDVAATLISQDGPLTRVEDNEIDCGRIMTDMPVICRMVADS